MKILSFKRGFIFVSVIGLVGAAQAQVPSSTSTVNASGIVAPEQELKAKLPQAPTASQRSKKGDISFNLQGKRFDDPIVKSRFSRLIVSLSLEADYQDWLQARLGASQLLTSGQASNLYAVTEGGTGSGLFIDEASLNLTPYQWVKGSAGILKTDLNPVYTHMYTQSNAGGSLEFSAAGDMGKVALSGSQTIPTSKGTSNRVIDEDTLPLLTLGSLSLEVPVGSIGFRFKTAATLFTFTDLSGQAAADSQQTGSTTVGNSKGGFLFAYEYRGAEYAAQIEQDLFFNDKITAKGAIIRNELAPQGKNRGWQGKLEYNKGFNQWNLVPSMVRFRIESDAIPSVYALPSVGFTNRQGTGYGLKLDFPKEKFNVYSGYTRSDVIDFTGTAAAFQADREIYTLGAEAKYDIF